MLCLIFFSSLDAFNLSFRIKYNNIRQLSLLYSQWPLDNTTVNQPKSIAQLKTMPSFTNVWSMKIGPQVILTSNEFETHRVTKVGALKCCKFVVIGSKSYSKSGVGMVSYHVL